MISKKFTKLAIASALALTTMFTSPAMAGKDFIKKDLSDKTTEVVQLVGEKLSADNLTFVVHGGNRDLQMAAYRTAQRLDDEGVPIAFLIAPDYDKNEDTSHVDFYTKGGTQYGVIGFSNGDMNSYENTLHELAMKAVKDDFPQYVASSNVEYKKTDINKKTPLLADTGDADCLPADKAQVTQVKGQGARIMDFTNSSQACLEDFASKASRKYLTLVAKSNSQAWRDATVEAAKMLDNDGALVMVAYTNDEDGLNNTAETWAWANGVERSVAPVSINNGYTIDQIAAAPDKVINYIHEVGSDVWNTYLKVPTVAD